MQDASALDPSLTTIHEPSHPIQSMNLGQRSLIGLIQLYQVTLSPDHSWLAAHFPGGYCRFSPSCSQYTLEAIERRGAIRGSLLGAWRILRCNPWSVGGQDEVPAQ